MEFRRVLFRSVPVAAVWPGCDLLGFDAQHGRGLARKRTEIRAALRAKRVYRAGWGKAIVMSGILPRRDMGRSEEHTSELQSLMRISYAVFCLKKKKKQKITNVYRLQSNRSK